MPMDVVRVKCEESFDRLVDLAAQTCLNPFAHHRALLARDREHVGFDLGQDFLAEGHVQVLARPGRLAGLEVAQLEIVRAQLLRQLDRVRVQLGDRLRVGGCAAAVHAEGKRHQRVAEEQASDLRQR